jgi:hypothetical protein
MTKPQVRRQILDPRPSGINGDQPASSVIPARRYVVAGSRGAHRNGPHQSDYYPQVPVILP